MIRDSPENPKTLTLPAIAQLLKDLFKPKKLIIAKRFTFHRRNQRPGETIAEYDSALCFNLAEIGSTCSKYKVIERERERERESTCTNSKQN